MTKLVMILIAPGAHARRAGIVGADLEDAPVASLGKEVGSRLLIIYHTSRRFARVASSGKLARMLFDAALP
jgi:hypothetical protein